MKWRGWERNNVWRHLVGPGTRAVHTAEERTDLEARMVADLRLTAARYPADQRCKQLIRELTALSPRFVELWACGPPELPVPDYGRHKVIDHPTVGHIALECDTLIVASDDCASRSTPPNPTPSMPNARSGVASSARKR